MKNSNTLSIILNNSTTKFVLLDILTLGFYSAIVFAWKHHAFKEEMGIELFSMDFLIKIILILGGIDFALYFLNCLVPEGNFDGIAVIANFVCWLMFSLKMRSNLMTFVAKEFRFDIKASTFLIVLFSQYYIVYLINNLSARHQMHQALFGDKAPVVSEEKSDIAAQ